MTTTNFPDTSVLTSTALAPQDIENIFQILTTQMLGIASQLEMQCTLEENSNIILAPLVPVNIAIGFFVVATGIPIGSYITGLAAQGTNFLITISNQATISSVEWVDFYDPQANTRVRPSWQTQGMPAFGITDDVVFLRLTEDITEYSTIRDEQVEAVDLGEGLRHRTYSRMWNVFFRARGPNSFDSIRVIKSMLLEDVTHDTLSAVNLYLTGILGTPVRMPELFEGQWWEQVDFTADFFEQVDETYTINTVTEVEVIGTTNKGTEFTVDAEID